MRHPLASMSGATVLLALSLSGCGESDLPAHHEAVLACAEIERSGGRCDAEPIPGAANPDTGSGSPGSMFVDRPAGALAPGEEPVEGIDLEDYELVFADDFTSPALDLSLWKTAFEWGPDLTINAEQQYYVDIENDPEFGVDPFELDGESLTIRAQRTPEALRAVANEQPWLSGVLSGASRLEVQYGYVEARVALPEGQGVGPSFWLLASDLDARRPRVFITEYDGGRPGTSFHDYQYEDADGAVRSAGRLQVDEPSLADGFHTLGVSWTPDELVYYIDGIARYRVIGDELPAQPMYPVLSLSMGGTLTGPSDQSTPASPALTIDYVRVWQRRAP